MEYFFCCFDMKSLYNHFVSNFRLALMLSVAFLFWSSLSVRSATSFSFPDDEIVVLPDSAMVDSTAVDSVLPWPDFVKYGIDSLLQDEMFLRSQLGLVVYDLTADSLLYEYGPLQLMRPASVQKLLTCVTALHDLGGDFEFTTRLYQKGVVVDSILQGDLFIKGGFDPQFGSDDMEVFAEALVNQGIKTIAGQVYSDMSLKDTLKWGEGWCWDDEEKILRPLLYNNKDVFIPKFYEKLTEKGITYKDSLAECLVPVDSVRQIAHRSHTVDQILMQLLKNSDNLYAEALFYQLGAIDGGKYPSARVSAGKVEKMILKMGLNPEDYNVADGSGLSLYNYVTAQEIVRLLQYMWKNKTIFDHIYPALPIAGVDGTLERRMRNSSAEGNVHAKTGTLRGVSTLAGYATAANGHFICFSILNQGIRSRSAAHHFQDQVCKLLTRGLE